MSILVLWAAPRTVSTAFERMMIERSDHLVLDEPWSRAYYFGPERRSNRYPLTFPESTYAGVEAGVLSAGADGPVFVKDMGYHAAPGISDEALASMTHTFLIRDPRVALASLYRHWPDFTEEEAGFVALRDLFERVTAVTGTAPVVLDSDRLRADPAGVIARWCAQVGIDDRPDALRWQAGMRDEWQLWRDWYQTAGESTGFALPGAVGAEVASADAPVAPRVVQMLPTSTSAYESLASHVQ